MGWFNHQLAFTLNPNLLNLTRPFVQVLAVRNPPKPRGVEPPRCHDGVLGAAAGGRDPLREPCGGCARRSNRGGRVGHLESNGGKFDIHFGKLT